MRHIITVSTSFLFGILFSIGLSISGMVNPNIVLGFLDIFGAWDPTLIFVMIGALAISLIAFTFVLKKGAGFSKCELVLPKKKHLDFKLISGAVIFGIGWGLTGICPGPGIANLILLNPKVMVFVTSMIIGMMLAKSLSN